MQLYPKILAGNTQEILVASEEAQKTGCFESYSSNRFSPFFDLIDYGRRYVNILRAPDIKIKNNGFTKQ